VGIPADIEILEDRRDAPFGPAVHPLRLAIEEHEGDIKQSSNVFALIGKVWFVKYAQEEWGLYPDQEKYRYIARLLSLSASSTKSPHAEYSIYNDELYQKVSGKLVVGGLQNGVKVMRDLNESDLSDKLAVEDIRKFRTLGYKLLEQLRDARDGGNRDSIKKAEENIDTYRSHVFNEYGIKAVISKDEETISFRVFHRASTEIEKLRQLVKNQINKAIKDFDTMPKFKFHLKHSLKMKSNRTFYSFELPTIWYVSI
jgi:hypothetical protein